MGNHKWEVWFGGRRQEAVPYTYFPCLSLGLEFPRIDASPGWLGSRLAALGQSPLTSSLWSGSAASHRPTSTQKPTTNIETTR